MDKYKITQYTYDRAKELGVEVKPSTNKNKKIDVYKGNQKVASIGAMGYLDFAHYKKIDERLAKQRRALYKKRHEQTRNIVGSPAWYADQLLW